MATDEARALLDALMGGDRNAPLPRGAAVPGKLDASSLKATDKRKKSCFDKDIDPLHTAWGVDVYDLFVNTKSDIGTNPYIVDEAAHTEFQQLSAQDQERLGFHYQLFQKLSELVRQCDRMVARNKEKLRQEVNRKLSQRGGQDLVEHVDEQAVEQVARHMVVCENLNSDLTSKLLKLEELTKKEEDRKMKLEPLLASQRKTSTKPDDEKAEKSLETEPKELSAEDRAALESLQQELGQLTLEKQHLVFDTSRTLAQIGPASQAVESTSRHLNYVKSDISTDMTVCEVSGNFMSARDADERIAAHYSGKQFVGWKLVRDKLREMTIKYGRYGPPPPPRRENHVPQRSSGGGYRGGSGGGRGGRDYRGGGGDRSGGRWERDRGSNGGYGGGGNYGVGGGFHDRGRHGGPPSYRGGGGGWRR